MIMEKIITLIMAALMACTGYAGSYEKPKLDENEMRITVVNETEDTISGFGMDYAVDDKYPGNTGGMVKGGVNKGEEFDLDLELGHFDLEGKESFNFAMWLNVFSEDGDTTYVNSYAQWDAQLQNEYTFVLTGSEEEGYDIAVEDEAFDCIFEAADVVANNEFRVGFVNESEDAIRGYDIDFAINGEQIGPRGGMSAEGALPEGYSFDFDFEFDETDLNSDGKVPFSMNVSVYYEDGSTENLGYVVCWDAEPKGEYDFVVSGSKTEGYEITAAGADFDCTITPVVG